VTACVVERFREVRSTRPQRFDESRYFECISLLFPTISRHLFFTCGLGIDNAFPPGASAGAAVQRVASFVDMMRLRDT
jgi:hypothetical protein